MTNPYAPSNVDELCAGKRSTKRLHAVAGGWLLAAGVVHFLAINLLPGFKSFSRLDWTPLVLSGLGLCVVFNIRIAIAFTRLIGSLVLVGLVLASILILVGYGDGVELTYGDTTVTDPQPWQVTLSLAAVAATMIPPWWMLQRALAGNNRAHASKRAGRF